MVLLVGGVCVMSSAAHAPSACPGAIPMPAPHPRGVASGAHPLTLWSSPTPGSWGVDSSLVLPLLLSQAECSALARPGSSPTGTTGFPQACVDNTPQF